MAETPEGRKPESDGDHTSMNGVTFRLAQMGITIVLKDSLLRVDEVAETSADKAAVLHVTIRSGQTIIL